MTLVVIKNDQKPIDVALENLKAISSRNNRKFKLKKTPIPRNVKQLQRQYLKDINKIVDSMIININDLVYLNVSNFIEESKISINIRDSIEHKIDDFIDTIRRALEVARLRFLQEYSEQDIETIIRQNAYKVDNFNINDINRIYGKVLNIQILSGDIASMSAIKSFVSSNVSLITSIEDNLFSRVKETVLRGVRSGALTRDIQNEIQKAYNVSRSKAALIARDQTAKLNSDLTQYRHIEAGVNKYKWATSGDERVRTSHQEKDGKIFYWNDPPSDTGHPGQDFQCRCVAIPIFED